MQKYFANHHCRCELIIGEVEFSRWKCEALCGGVGAEARRGFDDDEKDGILGEGVGRGEEDAKARVKRAEAEGRRA